MLLHDHHLAVEHLTPVDGANLAWFGLRTCLVVPAERPSPARNVAALLRSFERQHAAAARCLLPHGILPSHVFGVRYANCPPRHYAAVFDELEGWVRAGLITGIGPVDLVADRSGLHLESRAAALAMEHVRASQRAGCVVHLRLGPNVGEACIRATIHEIAERGALRLDVSATTDAQLVALAAARAEMAELSLEVTVSVGEGAFGPEQAAEACLRHGPLRIGSSLERARTDVSALARVWDALERQGIDPTQWVRGEG